MLRRGLLGLRKRRAAGHPGFEAGELRAHRIDLPLNDLNCIGTVRTAVAWRNLHQQILAVIRGQVAVAHHAGLLPDGIERIPWRGRNCIGRRVHSDQDRIEELQVHAGSGCCAVRVAAGNR